MRYLFLLFICLLTILWPSCSHNKSSSCDVLVTVPPYLYFIEQLSGGELSAQSLVPSGANPHLYEPSHREITTAYQAKVWIQLGETFEKKVLRTLHAHNPKLLVINLSQHLSLPHIHTDGHVCSHEHPDGIDLHFWLSLPLAKQQASLIANILIQAFPEKKELIQNNLVSLLYKIDETHRTIKKQLSPYQGNIILVSHPAFGYFCYDYNLIQLSVECEGKDPLPRQVDSLLQRAKSSHIQAIFLQAQYNNKGAELIAKQLGISPHLVDPYSPKYIENMLYITHCIVQP